MELLPRDPERRWNRLIAYGIGLFTVWIALIIAGQLAGTNHGVKDDAALVIAVGGFLALLLGQYQHSQKATDAAVKLEQASAEIASTRAEVAAATEIAAQVYEHINNVEESERVPEDGEVERPTLGSMLRRIDDKVDQGFAELRAELEQLRAESAVPAPRPAKRAPRKAPGTPPSSA